MLKHSKNREITNLQVSKDKAAETLELARRFHERYLMCSQVSDLNTAIEHYIETIKLNPNISETYYRLASLLFENGQIGLDTAIEQCKNAIKINPNNPNAYLYTGYFMKLANMPVEAEANFYKAIQTNPLISARARMILALSLGERMYTGLPVCLKCFYYFLTGGLMFAWDFPSLKMFGKNISGNISVMKYNFIGSVFEKFKKYSAAIKNYDLAAEKTGHEEIYFKKIGDICIKEQAPEIAVDAYRNVLHANPYDKDSLIKLATVIQTYFPECVDEAVDCYNKLLEIEPNKETIYYELGHLYLKKEDTLNAIHSFKLSVKENDENAFAHNSLAYALVQAEQFDEAIEHYKKAIKLNPDKEWTSIVCQALGLVYNQIKGNEEAAIAMYDTAILLDPTSIDSYISIGDIYFNSGNLENAIQSYCDAINCDSENAHAYCKLGISLWEKEYVEEAIIAYNKAISLNPEYDIAYNNLGVIYLDGIGNVKEALKLFEEAIAINPNYTMAYFNIARCYDAMGENTQAAEYYQLTLDLNKITDDIDEDDINTRLYRLFEV